jgi:HK97 family phage major capsid protein
MPSPKQKLQQKQADLVAEAKKVFDLATAEARPLTEAETKRDDEIQIELDALKSQIAAYERQEARERDFKALDQWKPEEAPKEPKDAPEANGFATWGEELQAMAFASMPGKKHHPNVKKLYELQAAVPSGMNESTGADGGFLVGKQQEKTIREKAYETGQILQRTEQFPIGEGFNGAELFGVDETSRADGSRFGGIRSYWLDEAGQITGSKPKFHKMDMKLRKVGALVYATDELIADSVLLEAWINARVPTEITFRVEDAIVNGDGAGKPQGFLVSGAVISVPKEAGQAAATVLYDNVNNMWSRMWAASRLNAVWLTDQSAEPQLHKMHMVIGTGGVPVYLPANGLSGQPFATLFGRPVIPIEYGAVVGTSGDLMLVDLSQYTTIDKGAVQKASSMHVRFEYDEMAFRFIWRIDGQSSWKSALTPKSGGPTLSPFVTLATRA